MIDNDKQINEKNKYGEWQLLFTFYPFGVSFSTLK